MHAAVAHPAFQRVVVQITIAAMQLQGIVAQGKTVIGGEALGHGAVQAGLAVLLIQLVRGQAYHLPAGGEVGEHVGQLELQGLELAEWLAELFAFLHVAQRLFQRRLGRTERATGDVDAAAVQALHGVDEALALGADAVAGGDAHGLEGDGAGRLGAPAHLQFVAAVFHPGGVGRHQEAGNPLGAAVLAGTRHDDQHVGRTGARDKALAAVDQVVVTVTSGAGAQVRGVGTGIRLGQAVGGKQFATDQAGQPLVLERLLGEGGEHPGRHVVDGHEGRGGHTAGGQLLENQRGRQP